MRKHKYAFAALAALATTFASAATWTVTSTGDDASDNTTLRGAIAAAADGDMIEFDAALAGATIAIDKANGPLEWTGSLSIIGPASAPVTIDGGASTVDQGIAYNGGSRTTYLVHATDASATTTLKNLVFTGSKANQGKDTPDVGPAVSILGSAVIDNCVWTNNGVARSGSFGSADGGGCLRVGGDLTLTNSRFSKNGVSAGSSTYSIGGVVLAKGATVVVRNTVISETYGWGANANGNANDMGALAVGPATTSLLVEGCVFEKNVAQHGGGALYVAGASGGRFTVRDSRFVENKNVTHGIKHGGAVTIAGAGAYLFENVEFANNYGWTWGGAVRSENSSATTVFANCTFVNNTGNEWGSAVDTRGPAWFVNCTGAGNVNGSSQSNGGTVFVISNTRILNSAFVWNWSNNGSVKNDVSKYDGTLAIYNSWNFSAGTGANPSDHLSSTYDESTVFFAEPLVSLSSLTCFNNTYNYGTAIRSPVLSAAADETTPRVVEIDKAGVLFQAGWPVKHDANWENIAYSTDNGATWTALRGSADAATIFLAADSRGKAYPVADGIAIPPVGSATVPLHAVAWDVASNGGQWPDETTAARATSVINGNAPAAPASPAKSGWNFLGWNTDPDATEALSLAGLAITADTTFYAIFEEVSATDATVLWFDEDGATALVPAATTVSGGTRPTHVEPAKAATAQYTWAFAGWTLVDGDGTVYATSDLPEVSAGDLLSYKAVYEATVNEYQIRFLNENGTVLQSSSVPYGQTPVYAGETPAKASDAEWSYAFAGWSPAVVAVTEDADYTATYTATAKVIPVDASLYRRRLTMTATGYDGSETLANFPVLVRLSSAIAGFDLSTVADPAEIRFADASGNLVPYEIDTWNASSGTAAIWVSVPSLSGKDTTFTMFWTPDENAAAQPLLTASRVWTQAGYLGVWHFSPVTTARIHANSAQADHYASASADATEVNGVVGGAIQFPSGATTYVNDSIAWSGYTPNMTLEFWVDAANKGDARIFGSGAGFTEGASIYMSGYISGNGTHSYRESSLIPSGGWRHVSLNFSATAQANALADGATSYTFSKQGGTPVDGNGTHFFHNVADGSNYADYHALSLTSQASGSDMFKGVADEFRLRGENSSTDWMQANWDTQHTGTDFLTYGTVEFVGALEFSGLTATATWTEFTAQATYSVPEGYEGVPVTFTLVDENGTLVATAVAAVTLSPATPTVTATFSNLAPGTLYRVSCSADVDGTAIASTTPAEARTTALPSPTAGTTVDAATLSAAFTVGASAYTIEAVFTPVDASLATLTATASDDGTAVSAALSGVARDAEYAAVFRLLSGETVVATTPAVSVTGAGFEPIDAARFQQVWTVTVTNHFAADGTTELAEADFLPVPLRLSPGSPESFKPSRYSGGAGLRAVQNGQSLPIEIESWNPDGESIVWVLVPGARNGTTFDLLALPVDRSTAGMAALPPQRSARVWTKLGYVGVWHMGGDDPTAESTGLVGTPETANLSAPAVDETRPGPLGRSLASLRTSRFDLPGETTAAWDLSNGFSLETWLTPSSYNYARIFSAANTYDRQLSQTIGQTQFFLGNMDNHGPNAGWHEAGDLRKAS